MIAVGKYKTDENKTDIESERKARQALGGKVDELKDEVTTHKVKLANAPSMEQVRSEFVSKEMFKQMEKHMDGKFETLENGIDKILAKLEKK